MSDIKRKKERERESNSNREREIVRSREREPLSIKSIFEITPTVRKPSGSTTRANFIASELAKSL